MVVYNLQEAAANETDPDKLFTEGLYVWTGSEWRKIDDESSSRGFFYMPSFNIELTIDVDDPDKIFDLNLYDEYAKQFSTVYNSTPNDLFVSNPGFALNNVPTHKSGRLYEATELDYVVTYYDPNIITITGIDNNGVMSYTINSLDFDEVKSFINIVLVIK
jgi:hypothetical protein